MVDGDVGAEAADHFRAVQSEAHDLPPIDGCYPPNAGNLDPVLAQRDAISAEKAEDLKRAPRPSGGLHGAVQPYGWSRFCPPPAPKRTLQSSRRVGVEAPPFSASSQTCVFTRSARLTGRRGKSRIVDPRLVSRFPGGAFAPPAKAGGYTSTGRSTLWAIPQRRIHAAPAIGEGIASITYWALAMGIVRVPSETRCASPLTPESVSRFRPTPCAWPRDRSRPPAWPC